MSPVSKIYKGKILAVLMLQQRAMSLHWDSLKEVRGLEEILGKN
jgi:hypothetical protein